jgi:hypothetical protein
MTEASIIWVSERRWHREMALREGRAARGRANEAIATSLRYSPGWPLVMALGVSTMMWAVIVWGILKLF